MDDIYALPDGRHAELIDEDGVIIYASDKVKAAENPEQMLELLRSRIGCDHS